MPLTVIILSKQLENLNQYLFISAMIGKLSAVACTLVLLAYLVQAQKVMITSQFPVNAVESTYRLMVMQKNMMFISEQNRKKEYNVTVAPHPQMIYLTLEQYRAIYLHGKPQKKKHVVAPSHPNLAARHKELNRNVKTTYDWDLSYFDPVVYNQMNCGNCYAVATTGTINTNNRIRHPQVPRLSFQCVTDCSSANMGCNGGWLDETMDYARYTGIESERAYPINVAALQSGVTPNCQDSSSTNYKITGYAQASDETTSLCINRINVLYNMYSMTTAMYSGFSAFQFYESGLFTACPDGEMDHAVQFVGFYLDTESGYAHFKLKNSYGTGWGYGGYFYMAAYNLCHICEHSYYSF